MKFGPVPLEQAEGKILGHNIAGADGRRALRKGKPLTLDDIHTLQTLGRTVVYVAEMEPNDVGENEAALRVAQAVMGAGLRHQGPSTGRVNIFANTLGILRVDAARLARLNACKGITLATLPTNRPVGRVSGRQRHMVGTVKILPFAVPATSVQIAEQIAAESGPLIQVDPLPHRTVTLIFSGSQTAEARVLSQFDPPLRNRLTAWGATIQTIDFVPLEDEQGESVLARCLQERIAAGTDLIVLAGETAIMDEHDIVPRAIERAGGEVVCFGAPVDPGNLLMLAYVNKTPILGAPGCARSPKVNIIDWVLPRLLVGDYLTHADIFSWGHGGLLADTSERPMPRHRISHTPEEES